MQNLHLEQKDWNNILDHISRSENSHKVTIEVMREDLGAQVEVENVTLRGISYDPKGSVIAIRAGAVEHMIHHPAGIEIAQFIMVGKWAGQLLHVVAAVLFGVVGILIVWRPVVTAEILTLLMGAFFLVAGLFQLIEPFWIGLPGWGWHVLNGFITLVLGVLVLAQWPVSGLWVIGLFVGIELIFYGGAWVALALSLRGIR